MGQGENDRLLPAGVGQGQLAVPPPEKAAQGPEQPVPPAQLPFLQDEDAQHQAGYKDGDTVEDVQIAGVPLVEKQLAESQRGQSDPACAQEHPPLLVLSPQPPEGGRRQCIENHGPAYVPVERTGTADPVVQEGAVPEQGAPGSAGVVDGEEGEGDHHQVIGGQDASGPAKHKGDILLLPADEGHGQPHRGEQNKDVHPAEARPPDAVQGGVPQLQIEGVEQHHPEHGHAHQL